MQSPMKLQLDLIFGKKKKKKVAVTVAQPRGATVETIQQSWTLINLVSVLPASPH